MPSDKDKNKGKVWNVLCVGIGGQGVLTVSEIVAQAAFLAGCDVKKSEVHGMSQRGGSVTSSVRFGPDVKAPLISAIVCSRETWYLARDRSM